MRSKLLRVVLGLALLLAAALGVACTSTAPDNSPTETSISSDAVIIDVRTADEYAAGHLDGAINIDIYQSDFADKVAELDKDASYVVYCRTGVRAGNALNIMQDAGFAQVTNGMGMQDAAKTTGRAIVK